MEIKPETTKSKAAYPVIAKIAAVTAAAAAATALASCQVQQQQQHGGVFPYELIPDSQQQGGKVK